MLLHWNNLIIGLIVAAAIADLLLRAWRFFAKHEEAGCGHGCGSCANETKPPQLLAIKPLESQTTQHPSS